MTQEIGIRMALGAKQRDIVRLALSQGTGPVWVGAAVGLVLALIATRMMSSLLYQVTPSDPMTFAFVTAGLIAVAALANYIPARRAATVDPLIALRHE